MSRNLVENLLRPIQPEIVGKGCGEPDDSQNINDKTLHRRTRCGMIRNEFDQIACMVSFLTNDMFGTDTKCGNTQQAALHPKLMKASTRFEGYSNSTIIVAFVRHLGGTADREDQLVMNGLKEYQACLGLELRHC